MRHVFSLAGGEGVLTNGTATDFDALRNDIRKLEQRPAAEEEMAALMARIDAVQRHCQDLENELLEYTALPPKPRSVLRRVTGLLYVAVLAVVGILLLAGTVTGGRQSILGYSVYTVLSNSMRSVLPKDSLIIVRNVDPKEIQVGDDITYFRDEKSTITHRVITIYENYESNGVRGFQTQGVDNPRPDGDIIHAANVVGRVVFHVPRIGLFLRMVHENIYLSILTSALLIALVEVLQRIIANSRSKLHASPEETPAPAHSPANTIREDEDDFPDEPLPDG